MRDSRATRDREPNWKLAFGSGAFLLVWLIGLTHDVPLDVALVRGVIAAGLGAGLGVVVGMTLRGLKSLANGEGEKGTRLDVTVPADESELVATVPEADALSKTVPAAPAAPEFSAIDYKTAAKHVHSMLDNP